MGQQIGLCSDVVLNFFCFLFLFFFLPKSRVKTVFVKKEKRPILIHRIFSENESYFVSNNNSWIISNKSPTKVKTVTSPKLTSPSTPIKQYTTAPCRIF